MARKKRVCPERVKSLLQPDVMISLNQTMAGPLDLLRLREALAERLRSSADQPSVQEGAIQRMVRFKPETWAALNEMAGRFQAEGASTSPTRLAEWLIEAELEQLQTAS